MWPEWEKNQLDVLFRMTIRKEAKPPSEGRDALVMLRVIKEILGRQHQFAALLVAYNSHRARQLNNHPERKDPEKHRS